MKTFLIYLTMFSGLSGGHSLFAQQQRAAQLFVLGGVFSPVDDEVQNIYGDGPVGQLGIGLPLQTHGRLRVAVNFYRRHGDPFYQFADFNAGDAGRLTILNAALTVESALLTPNVSPKIYLGAGVDYVYARESINGQPDATASSVGAHLLVAPEIKLTQRLALLADVRFRFLEMTFKSRSNRYRFNLSGTNLLLGLAYQF